MLGYIHSLQSLGTVDGPGVRAVVFASGCPYRCLYCHNPDTWNMHDGTPTEHTELVAKIKRLYPYIKDGGVTLSGGEPLMQAEFFLELVRELHREGLNVAIDTSGAVNTPAADRLIEECDLILLDLKFTSDEDYAKYANGSLSAPLRVLDKCQSIGKPIWIRQVIVPGINDTEDNVKKTAEILCGYSVIERVELLPFRKLCTEKYDALGIPFPLIDTPAASLNNVKALEQRLQAAIKK